MNWITTILLFAGFFAYEFIGVKALHGIIEKKVWLSGLYSGALWVIYLFGIYEFVSVKYYIIPIVLGAISGTMLAVHLKKKQP